MSNSIWKTPGFHEAIDDKLKVSKDGKWVYWSIHGWNIPGEDVHDIGIEWAYLEDVLAQADKAERLQAELDETKKALLRDFEIRNDCLTKILESYLNFAGFVRAYPNVPNLPTFRAGNIIYDWTPVLEFIKHGRTDRALDRIKSIKEYEPCPKCGEKMDEITLLSLPPQTRFRCGHCGYTEDKRNK